MDTLNNDTVLNLCSYVDLASLCSLAVSFPQWKSLIFRTIQKRSYGIVATVSEGCTVMEYCSLDKLKEPVQIDEGGPHSRGERIAVALGLSFENEESVELPKFAWKYVPFHLMKIPIVSIAQVKFGRFHQAPSGMFDEVNEVLAKVKTDMLFLATDSQQEARKLLQTINFRPGSTVLLIQNTQRKSKRPLLPQCDLSNVSDFQWTTGHVLPGDLSHLLNSGIKTLSLEAPHLGKEGVAIVRKYVEKFAAGKAAQTRCGIDAHGTSVMEWFEEIISGRGTRMESETHKVFVGVPGVWARCLSVVLNVRMTFCKL